MALVSTPLRFGLMCSGTTLRRWQADCLDQLMAGGLAEPGLLIVQEQPPPPPPSLARKFRTLLHPAGLAWSLYNRRWVEPRAEAVRPVDWSERLKDVPRIRCTVIRKGKFSEYFEENDLAAIRSQRLDFLIRFAFGIIRGEVLSAARYGVWSFHHGDERQYRGAPPCFWEVYDGAPTTGAILQRLTERLDGGIVLRRGTFPTVLESYPGNRDRAHFLGVPWPAEVCRDIAAGNADYLDAAPSASKAPIYLLPTNAQMARFLLRRPFAGK